MARLNQDELDKVAVIARVKEHVKSEYLKQILERQKIAGHSLSEEENEEKAKRYANIELTKVAIDPADFSFRKEAFKQFSASKGIAFENTSTSTRTEAEIELEDSKEPVRKRPSSSIRDPQTKRLKGSEQEGPEQSQNL
jgi:hypothetical protein